MEGLADTGGGFNKLHQGHEQLGAYNTLVRELTLDDQKFKEFCLDKTQFARVLSCVKEDLVKFNHARQVICPQQRLAICIW